MLKFYECYVTTYCDGKKVGTKDCGTCVEEEGKVQNQTEKLTWENITEKYQKEGICYNFTILNLKKGRKILFLNDIYEKCFRSIKEWKQKELNIEIEYEYRENKYVSINDVLKLHNVEKAIQYLNERGLTIS